MEEKILKNIIENREKFIPHLFTAKQVELMQKYLYKREMTPTEKTYLYSTIKKKIDALMLLKEEFHIKGSDMIPERVAKAKEILTKINKEKAFISGTFLFAQDYNDIDIYVISNKRKQFHQPVEMLNGTAGNKEVEDREIEHQEKELHFIYITEDDLKKPIFNSASQYCVANFLVETPMPIIKRPTYNDLVMTYEGAINEMLNHENDVSEEQKEVRALIFYHNLLIKNTVFDSFTLYKKFNEVIGLSIERKIEIVNTMAKEMLLKKYSLKYLHNALLKFIKQLEELRMEFPKHNNLPIYIKLFTEVKDGCRTA
jgi:hypothetical protein